MAMNFPDAPTTGDIYGPYQWDGEKWVTTGSGDGGSGGSGGGDVYGPTGATFNGLAVYADETGKVIKDSGVLFESLASKTQTAALIAAVNDRKVSREGDVMTGSLAIQTTMPDLSFYKTIADTDAYIASRNHEGWQRWSVFFGNRDPETGADTGNNFAIYPHNDGGVLATVPSLFIERASGLATVKADPTALLGIATKQYVDAIAMAGGSFVDAPSDGQQYARQDANWAVVAGGGGATGDYLPLAGGTLTGDLTINKATPTLVLDGTGALATILGQIAGKKKWEIILGENTNTDFSLRFYDSAGTYRGEVLNVEAASGQLRARTHFDAQGGLTAANVSISVGGGVYLARDPVELLEAATKQYVDAVSGGGGGEGGAYLPLTGGTLTGPLMLTPGTAAGPAVTFGATNTGIHGGSSAIRFATNGANRLMIDVASITSMIPINLPADPANPLEAATKQYVDAVASGGGGGVTGDYLPLAGGEITGNLSIAKIDPSLVLERPDTLSSATIVSKINNVDQWKMTLGIIGDNDFILHRIFGGSELGAFSIEHDTGIFNIYSKLEARADINTPNLSVMFDATLGRDPTLPMHAATKQYVDAVAGGGGGATGDYLPLTGGTVTGNLRVEAPAGSPAAYLIATQAQFMDRLQISGAADESAGGYLELGKWANGLVARVYGSYQGTMNWDITLGNESPSGFPEENWQGNDFEIASYDNFGRNRDVNFRIDRYSGKASVHSDPVDPLGIATKQYVDARMGRIYVDDTMPDVDENVLWWDTVEGQLYIRVYDADYSLQWVQAVPDPHYMLKTTGGSMTGPLLLAADPTQPLEAATKQYVDGALAPLADLEARIRKLEQA